MYSLCSKEIWGYARQARPSNDAALIIYIMSMATTIEDKIVAILYGVLEDTDATVADLKNLGVPHHLIQDILPCILQQNIWKEDEYLMDRTSKLEAEHTKGSIIGTLLSVKVISNKFLLRYKLWTL